MRKCYSAGSLFWHGAKKIFLVFTLVAMVSGCASKLTSGTSGKDLTDPIEFTKTVFSADFLKTATISDDSVVFTFYEKGQGFIASVIAMSHHIITPEERFEMLKIYKGFCESNLHGELRSVDHGLMNDGVKYKNFNREDIQFLFNGYTNGLSEDFECVAEDNYPYFFISNPTEVTDITYPQGQEIKHYVDEARLIAFSRVASHEEYNKRVAEAKAAAVKKQKELIIGVTGKSGDNELAWVDIGTLRHSRFGMPWYIDENKRRYFSEYYGQYIEYGENEEEFSKDEILPYIQFKVPNKSKHPMKFAFNSMLGNVTTLNGNEYATVWNNNAAAIHAAGCLATNDDIIVNPNAICVATYNGVDMGSAKLQDAIGGKLISSTGSYNLKQLSDYDVQTNPALASPLNQLLTKIAKERAAKDKRGKEDREKGYNKNSSNGSLLDSLPNFRKR